MIIVLNAWEKLKMEFIFAPIISALDWSKSFKIMCDASDFAIGVVLGQQIYNKQHVIYYSSRMLNDTQLNYTTTEKEFLAVVFALKKNSIPTWDKNHHIRQPFHTSIPNAQKGHEGPTYSLDPPPSRIWLKIRDKKGVKNIVADYLSCVPNTLSDELPINDNFPDEQLLAISMEPWFADIVNYLVTN